MKRHHINNKRLLSAIISLLVFLVGITPITALAAGSEKVTVAYIDYNNFIEENNGAYYGYGADYLNRIAAYTGWQYEFVDMEWTEAYEAVKAGTVDFYCVARQTEERQNDFDFSLYPVCNEEMNIYVLPEKEIYYQDYSAMNGKKVGMLASSGEIDYFKQYSAEHGFSCTIIEYPMNDDAVKAMENGEVDMIALVNYSVGGNYKLVGNFGVSPAYMMSCQGSPLMTEFSKAQEKLHFDDPNYTAELEKLYYGDAPVSSYLMLTREEADYIAELKKNGAVLNVAVSFDMAPIEYYDNDSKSYKGLTIDLYNRISELTGLSFSFVRREDKGKLLAGMQSGQITLVGAMAQNTVVEKNLSLIQSKAFSENMLSAVTKDFSVLSVDSVVAIPSGYPQFSEMAKRNGYTNFLEYPTFEECISAVDKGKADLTYIINMCEGYLLDHAAYADLKTAVSENSGYGICFGVYNEYDSRLISVINKCISVIPSREVNELIIENTASAEPEQSFADFIVKNSVALLIAAIVFLAFLAVIIIWAQKNRQKSRMNEKLKQHHDYLQHLYNTLPCGILRYEYDAPHKIISFNASCAKIYGYDGDFPVIGKSPDVVVEAGTEEAFQRKFDECIAKNGIITYDWPITRLDGSQAFTESVMDIVETENGKVFQEVIIDITERKRREIEIEKRYNNEIHRSNKRDNNLLYTACFDITEQILTETDIDVPGINNGISVDAFVAGLKSELTDQQSCEAMEDFATRFTIERMNNEYENGHFEFGFDLCRENNGQIQWLRSDLVLRHNPMTGHLMCFDYIYDVTDERVTKHIVRKMAFTDCENFASVYIPTGRSLQYTVESENDIVRANTDYMVNDVLTCLCEEMTADDASEFRKATDLSTVVERLKENTHYQVYATLHGTTETRQDKTIQIIAQSADAFNEDISKALSSGMNAHVSKPIKPDVLAKALHKAFYQEK